MWCGLEAAVGGAAIDHDALGAVLLLHEERADPTLDCTGSQESNETAFPEAANEIGIDPITSSNEGVRVHPDSGPALHHRAPLLLVLEDVVAKMYEKIACIIREPSREVNRPRSDLGHGDELGVVRSEVRSGLAIIG